ncbi:MAG: hypothetical protein ACKVP7_15320 [Hyphomicrobiaceae bacterium]
MRTTAFDTPDVYAPSDTQLRPASNVFTRLMDGWRAARADAIPLDGLAHMDTGVLRDIGIEADEIERLHAGQAVTPRAWQR